MTVGNAVQRGTLVYIYDENFRQTTSVSSAGRFPSDGLVGYTAAAVHVRRGSLIYAYDEQGRILSKVPVQQPCLFAANAG